MAARKRVPAWRTYTPELVANVKYRYEETPEPVGRIAADMGIHPGSLRRIAYQRGWVRHKNLGQRDLTPAMRLLAEAEKMEASTLPPRSGGEGRHGSSVSETRAGVGGVGADNARWTSEAPPTPDPSPPFAPLTGGGEAAPPARVARKEFDAPGAADASAIDRLEQAVLKELSTVEAMRAQFGAEPYKPQDAERTTRTLSNLTETLSKLQRLRAGLTPQSGSSASTGFDDDDMPEDIDEFRRNLARRIQAFVASRTNPEQPG